MEEVEAMLDVLEAVAWIVQARPAAKGEVVAHDDVMYCQKASLVHSPCRLMSIWSKPCL